MLKGGFADNPLRLNKASVWNENTIQERAEVLMNEMLNIWPYSKLSEKILEKYKPELEKKKGNFIQLKDILDLVKQTFEKNS